MFMGIASRFLTSQVSLVPADTIMAAIFAHHHHWGMVDQEGCNGIESGGGREENRGVEGKEEIDK